MFQAADKSLLRLKMATERTILRILAVSIAPHFGLTGVALRVTLFPMVYMIRYLNYARQADPFSRRTAIVAMAPALDCNHHHLPLEPITGPIWRMADVNPSCRGSLCDVGHLDSGTVQVPPRGRGDLMKVDSILAVAAQLQLISDNSE